MGASWEGFVVEQVRAHLPVGAEMGSHHTAVGAELDIVVQTGRPRLGIEVKFWSALTVTEGFWQAIGDLKLDRPVVLAPVERRYPLKQGAGVGSTGDAGAVRAADVLHRADAIHWPGKFPRTAMAGCCTSCDAAPP